jgi:hypothetical protein
MLWDLTMKATSFFLPADGSSEGIVLAAIDSHLTLQNPALTNHTISTFVIDSKLNVTWMVTGVYTPRGIRQKNVHKRAKTIKTDSSAQLAYFGRF